MSSTSHPPLPFQYSFPAHLQLWALLSGYSSLLLASYPAPCPKLPLYLLFTNHKKLHFTNHKKTSPKIPTLHQSQKTSLHQSQKNFTKNTYSSPITKNFTSSITKNFTKNTYSSPVIHKASFGRPFVSLMNKANAFLLFFLQGPSYYLKEYTHTCVN